MRKPGLCICNINVDTQKIDGSKLGTYNMIIALSRVDEKDEKSYFFEETFLLAEIKMDIVFEIRFATLNNVQVNFNICELKWKSYPAA